jgi:hypothetical protein
VPKLIFSDNIPAPFVMPWLVVIFSSLAVLLPSLTLPLIDEWL